MRSIVKNKLSKCTSYNTALATEAARAIEVHNLQRKKYKQERAIYGKTISNIH